MNILETLGYNPTETEALAILGRLLLAMILGGVIGFEREIHNHASGFRTHMLVSSAAAIFTILTLEIYYHMDDLGSNLARVDPIRVIEAVTAGVAFLAAGSIIRSGTNVRGLTTGAVMWMAGAIGVACGAGFMLVALVGTGLALVITFVLKLFEDRAIRQAEGDPNGEERNRRPRPPFPDER